MRMLKPPPKLELNGEAIGARIRARRLAMRWRQIDLARRIGRSKSVVCSLEKGRWLPTFEVSFALAVVFRRSLEWLYFGLPRRTGIWKLGT